MLRKVFGRDREDTPSTSVPAQTREASSASTDTSRDTDADTSTSTDTEDAEARRAADDLVAASFDNPQVPKARSGEPADTSEAVDTSEAAGTAKTSDESAVAGTSETLNAEATAVETPETETPAEATAPQTDTATEAEAPAATVEGEAAEPAPPLDAEVEAEAEAGLAEPEAAVATDIPAEAAAAAEVEPEAVVTVDAPEEQADAEDTDATAQATAEPETDAAAEAEPVVADADDTNPAEAEAVVTVDAPEEQSSEAEPEAAVAADSPAEPEAEVEPEAAVAADAPAQPETVGAEATVGEADTDAEADTHTDTDADTDAAPALPLARLKAAAPHLADAYKAAGAVLKKQGLTGARAAVYLVVDRSGSMRGYFKDGSVQRLAEQTVALAAHLDEAATVTTVFFSTDIDGTVELAPADLTPTRVEEINGTLGRLGRTNYHRAVEEVLAHHERTDPTRPALVVFQTDGAPESKTAATQALAEAADRPLHWRFVAWGEEDNKAFDYLRKLDGTPRTATYFAGATPVETAHPAFYRGLLDGLEF
ncbi:VWA domain-containing protein [Streptomyces narbonensis]|nr:VWA domain-containing protein [Streptomyces narbonensis]